MAITIISDPSHVIQVSPEIVSRLLATESPNIFKLQRKDFAVSSCESNLASPPCVKLTISSEYIGSEGNSITIYDDYSGAAITGTVTDVQGSPATILITDIPWVPTYDFSYLNDNTLFAGYYFEGRLTVNNVVETMTVIASPDSKGIAEMDVSGILRIKTSPLKVGDNTSAITVESTKSGKFTFEYRGMYYGASDSAAYTAETNMWYYVEAIRSEEEGSNLYDFLATSAADAQLLNMFETPVFWSGLPFDISLFIPVSWSSPSASLAITGKKYNAAGVLLSTDIGVINPDNYEGFINSLNIAFASLEESASYMTIEID